MLSALSAGPVGVGDRIGEADISLIHRTCRADGVLVRPSVPIAATDRAAYTAPVWSGELIVGSTHTQHQAGRWGYVLVANVGSEKATGQARIRFADLGEDRPATDSVAVFDWRAATVAVMPAAGAYDVELTAAEWDYRVLAPVLAEGIAVIGDPALYTTTGDARIADVSVDGASVVVTVLGAGERVRVCGWSRRALHARSWSPAAGDSDVESSFDPESGVWEMTVAIPAAGWTKLHLRLD